MDKNKLVKKIFLLLAISMIVVIVSFGSFYTYWNTASPERTCASCHEIGGAVNMFSQSAHRDMSCKECHGTALSNGIHSLKEKGMMIVNHVNEEFPEPRMNEEQMLGVMENCVRCHASEYAAWQSGGHSATYSDIFLDETHNKTEQLNFDCLRCHGMYYEGTTNDLVTPIDIKGPWKLHDPKKADQPTMPCMACHEIHTEGEPFSSPDHSNPGSIFYARQDSGTSVSYYARFEKTHFSSKMLPKLQLTDGDKTVKVSDDHLMRNCIQCHAPNSWHEAGTGDDRTPRGVHEGISCLACHEPHSNDAKNSCIKCHPAISNCGIDVTTMNTSFADAISPNNIHWVSCTDCHNDQKTVQALLEEKHKKEILR